MINNPQGLNHLGALAHTLYRWTKAFSVSNADLAVNVIWCVFRCGNTLLYCYWRFCKKDEAGGETKEIQNKANEY